MPAVKGVAQSAAHKSKLSASVKRFNSGGTKTRDGVEGNNKYDSKKRLRKKRLSKSDREAQEQGLDIRPARNVKIQGHSPRSRPQVGHNAPDPNYKSKTQGEKKGFGQTRSDSETDNPLGTTARTVKPARSNKDRLAEIKSGRPASFSPVSRKGYSKASKEQASNSKVFDGRPGKGPQGKKGIVMGQTQAATESQPKQYSEPRGSDAVRGQGSFGSGGGGSVGIKDMTESGGNRGNTSKQGLSTTAKYEGLQGGKLRPQKNPVTGKAYNKKQSGKRNRIRGGTG